ncbi:MAG TPA: hypothetical protein VN108_06785 [Marmoricola sp.]|nr:hypothetical protein [Marmoricola sp.]
MGDRRLFRRSATSEDQAVIEADQEEPAVEMEDIEEEVCARSLLTVEGVISGVSLGARGDAPALEASIAATNSETGEHEDLVLVWLGRTEIAGVHPGRSIVATARVCSESGARVMYNPRYDLR